MTTTEFERVAPMATDTRTARPAIVRFLRTPFTARTWREFAFLVISAPLSVIGCVYVIGGLLLGAGLAITLLGFPILAGVVFGGRNWGILYRWLAGKLLDLKVDGPPAFTMQRPGLIAIVRAGLRDKPGWRGLLYVLIKFPIATVGLYGAGLFLGETVFLTTSPLWWAVFDPTDKDSHGVRHHSLMQFGDFFIDSWPRVLAVAVIGLALFFLSPWPIRALTNLDRRLIRTLLGPTGSELRVLELERTRAQAVEGSAVTLRRVERDLHDGTQARLVAMAMNLDRARDRLARGDDAGAAELIDSAHSTAKDALVELRDVVRSIHPPALDNGLADALHTLAARNAVPVRLSVDVPVRPSIGVETIAYFCVAELLTNVNRHSGARSASVVASQPAGRLSIVVSDDGRGGARVGTGSGLVGLTERVATVDGTLSVHSPSGGPTAVTISLPLGA